MKTTTVLLLQFLASISEAQILDTLGIDLVDNQIVGGQPTTSYNQFPYQVSLQSNSRHFCGGSILSSSKILTAAHCVYGRNTTGLTILAGVTELTSPGQRVAVREIFIHDGYIPPSVENDIAVLTINELSMSSNSVSEIRLYEDNVNPNEYAIVTGWGDTYYNGPNPNSLQRANLLTYDKQFCDVILNVTTFDTQLCAVGGYGHGICSGDSGGPLVLVNRGDCKYRYQIGIVSIGRPCALGMPDVYTNVSSYVFWITRMMRL